MTPVSESNSKLIVLPCALPKRKGLTALIDTGSDYTLIKAKLINGIKVNPRDRLMLSSASGHILTCYGSITAPLSLGSGRSYSVTTKLYAVADDLPYDVIVGLDYLSSNKAIINVEGQTVLLGNRAFRGNVDRHEGVVAHLGWKLLEGASGYPPVRVKIAVTCDYDSNEAGHVILKPELDLRDEWEKSFLFIPNPDSVEGRMLVTGVVRIDENNLFHVLFANFGDKGVMRKGNAVGTLVELGVQRADGAQLNSIGSTRAAVSPTLNEAERAAAIRDILLNQKMALTPEQKRLVVERMMCYLDVWALDSDPLNVSTKWEHRIRIIPHAPVYVKPYPLPHAYADEVRKQVDQLSSSGIIEPSRSPYNSPVVLVKQGSGLRIVNDYRMVNQYVVSYRQPLPLISDILASLGRSRFFSTLDIRKAFLNVRLNEESRELTAFSLGAMHWQYTSVCFGMKDSPSCFQNIITQVLSGMEGVQAYIDDVLVTAPSFELHLARLEETLVRIREAEFTLKIAKCQIFANKIHFLGHEISLEGIRPLKSKVAAVQDLAAPTTVRGVRQILGLFGYYRRFIAQYAVIAKPLTDLLRDVAKTSNKKIQWSDEAGEALARLKKELLERVTLAFPDYNYPLDIHSDASSGGISGLLSQSILGQDRPIFFFSRVLSRTEASWHSLEQEALALIYSLRQTRVYTLGHPVRIRTDCRSLVWLYSVKQPLQRLCRWQMEIASYEFEIAFVAGKLNKVADALSRLKRVREELDDDDENEIRGEPLVCLISSHAAPLEPNPFADRESIRDAQLADSMCKTIMYALVRPECDDAAAQASRLLGFRFRADEFVLVEGLLYRRTNLVKDVNTGICAVLSSLQVDRYKEGGADAPSLSGWTVEPRAPVLTTCSVDARAGTEGEALRATDRYRLDTPGAMLGTPVTPRKMLGAEGNRLEASHCHNPAAADEGIAEVMSIPPLSSSKGDGPLPPCRTQGARRKVRGVGAELVATAAPLIAPEGCDPGINAVNEGEAIHDGESRPGVRSLPRHGNASGIDYCYPPAGAEGLTSAEVTGFEPSVGEDTSPLNPDGVVLCTNATTLEGDREITLDTPTAPLRNAAVVDPGWRPWDAICAVRCLDPALSDHQYRYQLVVPHCMRNTALEIFHDNKFIGTHKSSEKMYLALQKVAFWPEMKKQVEHFVQTCEICTMFKKCAKWRTPLRQWKTPDHPNFRIHLDLCGPLDRTPNGHLYIMVVVCSFSKFVSLYPLKTKSAEEVAKVLVSRYFSVFGPPRIITSDLGTEFTNSILRSISQMYQIQQIFIARKHSSSNGQVERFVGIVTNLLRTLVLDRVRSWNEMLPMVALSLNSAYNYAVQDCPYYIVFLRDPYIPLDIFQPARIPHAEDVPQYTGLLREIQSEVYKKVSNILDENFKAMEKKVKRTKIRDVKIGDRVYIANTPDPYRPLKLQKRMTGPYRVIGRKSDVIVRVQRLSDKAIVESHLDHTIVCNERSLNWDQHPNVRRAYPIHDLIESNEASITDDWDQGPPASEPGVSDSSAELLGTPDACGGGGTVVSSDVTSSLEPQLSSAEVPAVGHSPRPGSIGSPAESPTNDSRIDPIPASTGATRKLSRDMRFLSNNPEPDANAAKTLRSRKIYTDHDE